MTNVCVKFHNKGISATYVHNRQSFYLFNYNHICLLILILDHQAIFLYMRTHSGSYFVCATIFNDMTSRFCFYVHTFKRQIVCNFIYCNNKKTLYFLEKSNCSVGTNLIYLENILLNSEWVNINGNILNIE